MFSIAGNPCSKRVAKAKAKARPLFLAPEPGSLSSWADALSTRQLSTHTPRPVHQGGMVQAAPGQPFAPVAPTPLANVRQQEEAKAKEKGHQGAVQVSILCIVIHGLMELDRALLRWPRCRLRR